MKTNNADSNFKNYINSKTELDESKDKKLIKKNDIESNVANELNYIDPELNSLDYSKAIIYDKRTYFQYYYSLIQYKQLVIFSFFTIKDYNSKSIKISLFFFFLALYLTINALFFNDGNINKIYIEKGKFNFVYEIPKIIYSSIISHFINILIKFLSLTESYILKLKENQNITKENIIKIENCLKIRFIIFFILEFSFSACFWYYLSCFCAVYRNTQLHLIKDTITSFGLDLLYPFFCL